MTCSIYFKVCTYFPAFHDYQVEVMFHVKHHPLAKSEAYKTRPDSDTLFPY